MMDAVTNIFVHALDFYFEAAPWLLFGLAAAGVLHAWIPKGALSRWLGGRGLGAVVRAALIGAPLPLCSCGVLPAALAVRREGASKGATVSFLIATPETGPDSVAVSYAMLGPVMAVARPVAAVLSAVFAGILTMWLGRGEPSADVAPTPAPTPAPTSSCGCSSSGGCGTAVDETPAVGFAGRTHAGLRYAMGDMMDDLAGWLFVGFAVAGALAAFVPPMAVAGWGSGLLPMLVMLAFGIPLYVCATASTPIAAALLAAGVSPGAALVFLLVGPATNMASLGVVGRELGARTLVAYLGGIAVAAVGLGLALDALVVHMGLDIGGQMAHAAQTLPEWAEWAAGAVLAPFMLRPVLVRVLRWRSKSA